VRRYGIADTMSRMDVAQPYRLTLASGRGYLNMALEGLTDEQFNWLPPNDLNPISALLFHIGSAEDFYIARAIGGGKLRFMTEGWAERTGVTEIPGPRGGWSQFRERRFEREKIQAYLAAVHATTDAYLDQLTEVELNREVTFLGAPGPVARVLGAVLVHPVFHTGEISLIKGLQGVKGIPI
jgi:uncharacterized damage-inducible protein DinB